MSTEQGTHSKLCATIGFPYPFPPEHRRKWVQILVKIPEGSTLIPVAQLDMLQSAYDGDLEIWSRIGENRKGDLMIRLRLQSEFPVQPEVQSLKAALAGCLKISSELRPQNWYELVLMAGDFISEDERPSCSH